MSTLNITGCRGIHVASRATKRYVNSEYVGKLRTKQELIQGLQAFAQSKGKSIDSVLAFVSEKLTGMLNTGSNSKNNMGITFDNCCFTLREDNKIWISANNGRKQVGVINLSEIK